MLFAFALPLRGLLRYQGPPMEEGFMLVFPQEVLRGNIPNRDFLHLYGPGSLWVLAAMFKLFGASLATERFVGLAQHLGVVFGVFMLARPWGRRVAVIAALMSLVIIVPPVGLSAMAWNGAVALGVWALWVALRARRAPETAGWGAGPDVLRHLDRPLPVTEERYAFRVLALAGLCGGAALLYRPDLIVAMSLALASVVWGQGRRAWRAVIAGGAVGVSPYLVHLAMAGPGHAFSGMVLDPVLRLRAGRSLPVPPPWGHLDGFLQKAAALRDTGWPLPQLAISNQVALWFYLVPLSALFVAGVGWWAKRRAPDSFRAQVLLSAGLFGVGMLTQSLQRPDTAHFAWVSCVPLALVPVAVAELLRVPTDTGERTWPARLRRSRPAAGAFTLAVLVLAVAIPHFTLRTYIDLSGQSFGRNVQGFSINHDGRNFYYGNAEVAAAANELIADLDRIERPGRRLFVGPMDLRKTPYSDAFFYFLFPDLEVGTYYIEMDPGMANAKDSGLADEVRKADYLILSDVWTPWEEPNSSRRFGPDEPNQVVAEEFCLVGSYGVGPVHPRGYFELYERCA